jgi:hypothetical protein
MKPIKPLIAASAVAGVLMAGCRRKRCGAACGEQDDKIVAPVTGVRFGG